MLSRLKAQPSTFPTIEVSYWPSDPLAAPVVLSLPGNGFRLRFDGPDQRLRLIEVLDFSRTHLTYDGKDFVKTSEVKSDLGHGSFATGPTFRYVYDKLLGPSFPGEYVRSTSGLRNRTGSYVLSYPGIAFSFGLPESAWQPNENFVALLSSPSAEPASSMAVFSGGSWQDACQDLYNRPCPNPRSLFLNGRGKEQQPDEIEVVCVLGDGRLRLQRRTCPALDIRLGVTSSQDLVAELGPPDAIYVKSDRRLSIHKALNDDANHEPHQRTGQLTKYDEALDTDRSSSRATTDDSEDGSQDLEEMSRTNPGSTECFYNYFRHGFDVFVSCPTQSSSIGRLISSGSPQSARDDHQLVASKILLHGNVPGSYPFNRHRRIRWVIDESVTGLDKLPLNSETPFTQIAESFHGIWRESSLGEHHPGLYQRGMPINRDWDSPGSSCELLGGWEEQSSIQRSGGAKSRNPGYGNTELFGYPGFIFEVLKNDTISCLTVY